jgi:hypothetical protein
MLAVTNLPFSLKFAKIPISIAADEATIKASDNDGFQSFNREMKWLAGVRVSTNAPHGSDVNR